MLSPEHTHESFGRYNIKTLLKLQCISLSLLIVLACAMYIVGTAAAIGPIVIAVAIQVVSVIFLVRFIYRNGPSARTCRDSTIDESTSLYDDGTNGDIVMDSFTHAVPTDPRITEVLAENE